MENEQKIPAGYEEAYNFLNAKSIHEMRQLARAFGVSKPSLDKKHDLIVRVIGLASGALKPDPKSNKGAKVKGEDASAESVEKVREVVLQCKSRIPYERVDIKPKQYGFNDSGVGTGVGKMYAGLLEFDERGGGRLRGTGCEASGNDAYLSESIIRRYYLREGDRVTCLAEERDGIPQAMQVTEVEGYAPIYAERKKFGELPAAYPNEQIVFAKEDSPVYFALDALCPIGYGQRVLAVAPRETGITSFLNAAADGRKLLAIPAALQHNIPPPPIGQDLALTGGVPEAGHEALAQLPAVAVLQDVGVAGDMVLFQNGRDLVAADLHVGKQHMEDLILGVGRQRGATVESPGHRVCSFLRCARCSTSALSSAGASLGKT